MALFGELDDLSLGELIEFFCNQRKTGRLKVVYPVGPGFFYLKSGAVVHAQFGDLRGIDAVYYALTQPNASFTFNAAFEPPEQTINQPWTSVVLEGLRRMDQGVAPPTPSSNGDEAGQPDMVAEPDAPGQSEEEVGKEAGAKDPVITVSRVDDVNAFGALLSQSANYGNSQSRRWSTPAVITAIALLIVGVGVPWGWYAHSKARQSAATQNPAAENPPVVSSSSTSETVPPPDQTQTTPTDSSAPADALAAKKLADARAKERARLLAQQANPAANAQPETAPKVNPPIQNVPAKGGKNVTVQVTYDENGRVTGASGGDATALRIARQRRFPAGKPGSATVTIPIN